MDYYYGYHVNKLFLYLWPWRRVILVCLLPYIWGGPVPKDCSSLWEELIHNFRMEILELMGSQPLNKDLLQK